MGSREPVLDAPCAQSANLELPLERQRLAHDCAIKIWNPLIVRLIELFLLTLECEHIPCYATITPPTATNKDFKKGRIFVDRRGEPVQVMHLGCPSHEKNKGCGWPLQRFPQGWLEQAKALLGECHELNLVELRNIRAISSRTPMKWTETYRQGGMSLYVLLLCLEACAASRTGAECKCEGPTCRHRRPEGLRGGDVHKLRSLLANWNSTRGLPGSETFKLYAARINHEAALKNTVHVSDFVQGATRKAVGGVKVRGVLHPVPVPVPVSLSESSNNGFLPA